MQGCALKHRWCNYFTDRNLPVESSFLMEFLQLTVFTLLLIGRKENTDKCKLITFSAFICSCQYTPFCLRTFCPILVNLDNIKETPCLITSIRIYRTLRIHKLLYLRGSYLSRPVFSCNFLYVIAGMCR